MRRRREEDASGRPESARWAESGSAADAAAEQLEAPLFAVMTKRQWKLVASLTVSPWSGSCPCTLN